MWWILYAALGLVVLWLVACVAIALVMLNMIVNPHRWTFEETRKEVESQGFEDAFRWYDGQDWTPFSVERDGVTLRGEYLRDPGRTEGPRKVAVFCHGHTVNIACNMRYVLIFRRLGYDVVFYDERSFGKSDGRICTLGQEEALDLRAVLGWVRETFGEDAWIGLHGESMGAATVLSVLRWERPAFVAADCPFADTRRLLKYLIGKIVHMPAQPVLWIAEQIAKAKYGYVIADVSPEKAVRESSVPVCLLHGTADDYIPCSHSQRMAEGFQNPLSRLELFQDAGHARSVVLHREDYEAKLTDFIESVERADLKAEQA